MLCREEAIIVNRVIRDDPSKGGMHNREPLTMGHVWKSLCDYDLWPLYLLGLTNNIPFSTPKIYQTLSLKGLGFTTFETNLLVIPSQLLHVVNMLALTYLSEAIGQLSLVALIQQIWAIPFLLWLRFADATSVSKWTVWMVMTVFLGNPYGMLLLFPMLGLESRGRTNEHCHAQPTRSRSAGCRATPIRSGAGRWGRRCTTCVSKGMSCRVPMSRCEHAAGQ